MREIRVFCSVCGAAVQAGHRFCASCGTPLTAPGTTGQLAPPSADEVTTDSGSWHVVEQAPLAPPRWQEPAVASEATYQQQAYDPAYHDPQYPQAPDAPYADPGYQQAGYQQPGYQAPYDQAPYEQHWSAQSAPTTAQPVYDPYAYAYQHQYVVEPLRRVTPLSVAAVLTGVVAVASLVVNVFAVKRDGVHAGGSPVKLADISSNATVVAVVVAVVAVIAAVTGAGSRRFGTGLAGGAGLAATGWAVLHIGRVLQIMDFAERSAINQRVARFTKVYDVGFFLLAAVAVLGVLLFVLSLPGSGNDGLLRVNPLTILLGVAGTLGMAIGPLIPAAGGSFDANFNTDQAPVALVLCRIGMLALLAFVGLAGFFNARRWGLATALGGVSAAAALWLTAMLDDKNRALGIGIANPGRAPSDPHVVTTLGVVAVLVAGAIAALVELQARQRRQADPGPGS